MISCILIRIRIRIHIRGTRMSGKRWCSQSLSSKRKTNQIEHNEKLNGNNMRLRSIAVNIAGSSEFTCVLDVMAGTNWMDRETQTVSEPWMHAYA